jgi:hypothetical protein
MGVGVSTSTRRVNPMGRCLVNTTRGAASGGSDHEEESTVTLRHSLATPTGAALCIAVAVIHVKDQGGLTALDDPAWLGWAYRLLELTAVLTALALAAPAVSRDRSRAVHTRETLVWGVALLVGAGPFIGFLFSRTTGLPGATDDIGNWGESLGLISLVVEALLIALSLSGARARVAAPAFELEFHPAHSR